MGCFSRLLRLVAVVAAGLLAFHAPVKSLVVVLMIITAQLEVVIDKLDTAQEPG